MATYPKEIEYRSTKFKASQVVHFNGVNELCELRKSKKFARFRSGEDPHPVDFQLELTFAADEPDFLGAFLHNRAQRSVYVYHCEFKIFSGGGQGSKHEERMEFSNQKISNGDSWGFPSFFPVASLKGKAKSNSDIEWRVKLVITYGGEFEESPVTSLDDVVKSADPRLPLDFAKLLESGEGADVTFLVDGVRIPACKKILGARSDHFRRMFQSGMKESRSSTVEINEADADLFKLIILFIYTGQLPSNLKEVALDLLPLADRYAVDFLKDACSEAVAADLSLNNVVRAVILAQAHHCVPLKTRSMAFLRKNLNEAMKTREWDLLKQWPDVLEEILKMMV